ncbi:mitochondrial carrier [Aulographum hederae CBS 113979]|uniref:Mitochondrial carrier n=1 Tax=Aulographum hederae CBS 113979 TaxID=1176131 RepID=A0A6G1GPN9_9PEZI|nr:mitochondrial carrier [Aulographum hederae CBS 113979]
MSNTNSDILIAGAIAAFTVDLLVYPLDTLKTRLQSPDYVRRYTDGAKGTVNRATMFRGLYQGVGSVIIATLPSSGAFFTTYESVKSTLTPPQNPSSSSKVLHSIPQPLIHSTASATAELVSCAILTPAEVIKQNAQMVSSSSSTSSSPTSRLSQNATVITLSKFRSNPLALWRGYGALASRNLPFTALQFPMFERLKEGIKNWRREKGILTGGVAESAMITAISAGSAGSVAAVITTPVDVIKTRIMLAASREAGDDAERKSGGNEKGVGKINGKEALNQASENAGKAIKDTPKNLADAMGNVKSGSGPNPFKSHSSVAITKEIFAQQGIKGLFRGGALRAVWTMLGSGLYLGTYESGRGYLARRRGETWDGV